MTKKKNLLITIVIAVFLLIILFVIFSFVIVALCLNGAFDKFIVTDIATFDSLDGNYYIKYQQIGDPEWPFGKTDVRLTLYDSNGQIKNSVDTFISDDGCVAHENNIKTIDWMYDSLKVILQASEMQDKEIIIAFNK